MEKTALELVTEERQRQIEKEGWSLTHDEYEHPYGELAIAAACYAMPQEERIYKGGSKAPEAWPWEEHWWKPAKDPEDNKERIRELTKAGALILAELERLIIYQNEIDNLD